MRAATGSQWRSMSSGVTFALSGWLNTRRTAAFWIICSGFTTQQTHTLTRSQAYTHTHTHSPIIHTHTIHTLTHTHTRARAQSTHMHTHVQKPLCPPPTQYLGALQTTPSCAQGHVHVLTVGLHQSFLSGLTEGCIS